MLAKGVNFVLLWCRSSPSTRNFLFFGKQLEYRGYCPVTFLQGYCRYESLVGGSAEHVVEHDGRLFSLRGEEELASFMRQPSKYMDLKLPAKLPLPVKAMNVAELPMLGYLEQTVAQWITKGIAEVGLKRPKLPCVSSKESALLYLALYLKAHNPRWAWSGRESLKEGTAVAKSDPFFFVSPKTCRRATAVQMAWRAKLRQFEERSALARYVGKHMPDTADAPRPADFDSKLRQFFDASQNGSQAGEKSAQAPSSAAGDSSGAKTPNAAADGKKKLTPVAKKTATQTGAAAATATL